MTELIINIAPEKEQLIKMLVEELGGEVIEEKKRKKPQTSKAKKSTSTASKKKKEKEVSPTFLFGKWKDFDIDARKLREETWGRKF